MQQGEAFTEGGKRTQFPFFFCKKKALYLCVGSEVFIFVSFYVFFCCIYSPTNLFRAWAKSSRNAPYSLSI